MFLVIGKAIESPVLIKLDMSEAMVALFLYREERKCVSSSEKQEKGIRKVQEVISAVLRIAS